MSPEYIMRSMSPYRHLEDSGVSELLGRWQEMLCLQEAWVWSAEDKHGPDRRELGSLNGARALVIWGRASSEVLDPLTLLLAGGRSHCAT
jgi:hypothetical protein